MFFVNQRHRKKWVLGERMNYSPLAWVLKLTAQNQQLLKCLPQTMLGGMSNHNRNNLKCSSVLRCTLSPFLLCALQAKTESGSPIIASGTCIWRKCKIHKVPACCHHQFLSMLSIKLAKTFPLCMNPLNNLHIPNLKVFIQSRNIDLTSFQCLP